MRTMCLFRCRLFVLGFFLAAPTVFAQPLVEGNLTLYYDFDEIVATTDGTPQFLDESGNGFHGTIFQGDDFADIEPGTLTVVGDAARGAGAAFFQQSPNADDLPVYVDVHGKEITENFPDRLPTSGLNDLYGITIAAWLKVPEGNSGDQSIFQARTSDGGHGAPHFQLQGDGRLRMTFRDQNGSTVANGQLFTDGVEAGGVPYPTDEWFHYAGSYDADEGLWWMYYNGELIGEGEADISNGGLLGDWGGQVEEMGNVFAAGFGAVYDSGGRRLNGWMDELYVYNRALTAEEILTLATPPSAPLVGDCNGDGVLDASDLACVADTTARDAVLTAINALPGDLDGNGEVEFADFLVLSSNFGMDGLGYSEGNIDLQGAIEFADFLVMSNNFGMSAEAAAVPEPSSALLFVLSCGVILRLRTRPTRKSTVN